MGSNGKSFVVEKINRLMAKGDKNTKVLFGYVFKIVFENKYKKNSSQLFSLTKFYLGTQM